MQRHSHPLCWHGRDRRPLRAMPAQAAAWCAPTARFPSYRPVCSEVGARFAEQHPCWNLANVPGFKALPALREHMHGHVRSDSVCRDTPGTAEASACTEEVLISKSHLQSQNMHRRWLCCRGARAHATPRDEHCMCFDDFCSRHVMLILCVLEQAALVYIFVRLARWCSRCVAPTCLASFWSCAR